MRGVRMIARPTIEEQMQKFDQWVKTFGYRPPVRADLVPGAELLMVEVERYMQRHNQGISFEAFGATRIRIDDDPLAPSRIEPGKEVVYYHCIASPGWDGQCVMPLEDFCASGYVKGCYTNDHRYIIKAR